MKMSSGKGIAVLDNLSGLDSTVIGATQKIKDQASLIANKDNILAVLNGAFVFVVRVLLAIVEWVRNHIHTLYEKARHEKPKLSGNASSSVYLKQISEVKEEKKDL
jgi:hypothetical protein